MKQHWKPGTMIYPLPAVLVSCGNKPENYNLITVAWTGTICSEPPMCYISIRRERHSYELIRQSMSFVINLTTRDLAYATDWCGVRSGRNFNKFQEMNLHAAPAKMVEAPVLEESPVNIECHFKEIISLGSHDMFIAEVLNVQADEKFIDPATGKLDLQRADLLVYVHGQYHALGEALGKFGWTVEKKK